MPKDSDRKLCPFIDELWLSVITKWKISADVGNASRSMVHTKSGSARESMIACQLSADAHVSV